MKVSEIIVENKRDWEMEYDTSLLQIRSRRAERAMVLTLEGGSTEGMPTPEQAIRFGIRYVQFDFERIKNERDMAFLWGEKEYEKRCTEKAEKSGAALINAQSGRYDDIKRILVESVRTWLVGADSADTFEEKHAYTSYANTLCANIASIPYTGLPFSIELPTSSRGREFNVEPRTVFVADTVPVE
jgi:hypothetical protein